MPNCNKTSLAKLRSCCIRVFLGMALVSPILLGGSDVAAQVAGNAPPAHQARRGARRPSLDDRIKTLAKSLELSEAQQDAVKKILVQRQQETLRIRSDSSISGSARIERFRALQDYTVLRIRAVLNEEQKKKYDPLAVRRAQPASDQRSVEEWLKISNSPR